MNTCSRYCDGREALSSVRGARLQHRASPPCRSAHSQCRECDGGLSWGCIAPTLLFQRAATPWVHLRWQAAILRATEGLYPQVFFFFFFFWKITPQTSQSSNTQRFVDQCRAQVPSSGPGRPACKFPCSDTTTKPGFWLSLSRGIYEPCSILAIEDWN